MNELSEDDFYTEIDRGAKDEGCLREDCEIAPDKDTHRVIRLPDIYRTEPTKIIKTYEKQITVDVVKHHIVEHVFH